VHALFLGRGSLQAYNARMQNVMARHLSPFRQKSAHVHLEGIDLPIYDLLVVYAAVIQINLSLEKKNY